MRRRRHKLEVSTFPFLAVLLCAMGSLILLLLVLDRRAKAAARERAQRAAEQVAADELRLADQRRLEWEKRRDALHAELLAQEQELCAKIAAVTKQVAAAQADAAAEEARHNDQRERLRREQAALTHLEEEVRGRRAETTRTTEQTKDSEQELRRLSSELRMLERTLTELKDLRKRQEQTYSVVPYRGRRGENRAPLYLECAAGGLIFHPDKKTISSPRAAADEIRTEVERRIVQQRTTRTAAEKAPDATPYLLLLVRPDGISTYYLTMRSLQGLDVDFGYELIDVDWVLEFPEEGDSSKPQPWMVVEKSSPATTPKPPPATRQAPPGIRPGGGVNAGGARPGGGSSSPSGPAQETTDVTKATSAGGAGPWRPASAGPLAGDGSRTPGNASVVAGSPDPATGPTGGLPSHAAIGKLSAEPVARSGDRATAGPTTGSGDAPASGGPISMPATLGSPVTANRPQGVMFGSPDQNMGQRGGSSSGVRSAPGSGLPGPMGAIPSGNTLSAIGSQGSDGHPPVLGTGNRGSAPGPPSGSTVAQPSGQGPPAATGDKTPIPGSTGGAAPPAGAVQGQPHSPTPIPGSAVPGSSKDRSSDQPGTSDQGMSSSNSRSEGAGNPSDGGGSRRLPLQGADNSVGTPRRRERPPEVRPAILGGNRDYIILVECKADAVVLYPFGTSFSADSLAPGNGGGQFLQEAINRLIARRQATVRPGEQPYRPQVRFLVRPDGLRSMHRVYPVLEALHIPLTRQNLDVDEEIPFSDY